MTIDTIIGNIISGAVGGLVVALANHFLTKDREHVRDKKTEEQAAANAKKNRLREFFNLVAEVKARITMSDNPADWSNYFKNDVTPSLLGGFEKISGDFNKSDKDDVELAVLEVVAYGKLNPSDIFGNKPEILKRLEKLLNFSVLA